MKVTQHEEEVRERERETAETREDERTTTTSGHRELDAHRRSK